MKPAISLLTFCLIVSIFTSCQKEFTLEDTLIAPVNTGTALFTFDGGPGTCSNPIVTGNYKAGVGMDSSNRVTLSVNVQDTGTYTIVGNGVNGIQFTATGIFLNPGNQSIQFIANGTPLAGGTFNFSLGNATCNFPITFAAATTNPVASAGCKECAYVPFCSGSEYEYIDSVFDPLSGASTVQPRFSDYTFIKDTTINGMVFNKLEISNRVTTSIAFVNCNNGETTTIAYNIQSTTSGNVLVALRSIELKANAAIGATWSDTSNITSGNILYRKHIIKAKGISKVINGTTYNDVFRVSVEQSVLYVTPALGLMATGVTDYYFAKGIGLIETITYGENPLTNQPYLVYRSVLKKYFIP